MKAERSRKHIMFQVKYSVVKLSNWNNRTGNYKKVKGEQLRTNKELNQVVE